MADLVNTIVMKADGTQAVTESARVAKSLADVGDAAVDAGNKTGRGFGGAAKGTGDAANEVDTKTNRIIKQFQRLEVEAKVAGKSLAEAFQIKADAAGLSISDNPALQKQLESLKNTDAAKAASALAAQNALAAQAAATKRLKEEQTAANLALRNAPTALNEMGMTAKQTTAALRQVPAQLTDIVVSLQGGQAPLTVLLQQGGQLKDVFGGIGNAAKALGGYLLALINPWTLVAAAVAVATYGFIAGRKEFEEYQKALILTGNNAGTTAFGLSQLADNISKTSKNTRGAAAAALTEFAKDGSIGTENLQRFATTALELEKTTGVAVADTVKQFAALGKDPVNASEKLNQSQRYLTKAVYEQVKALEDQGRLAEAGRLAQNSWADSLDSRTPKMVENAGLLEKAYNAVAYAVKEAGDRILNIGRPVSPLEDVRNQIRIKEETVATDEKIFGGSTNSKNLKIEIAELKIKEMALLKIAAEEENVAQAQRDQNTETAKYIEFTKLEDQYLSQSELRKRKIASARELAAASGIKDPQRINTLAESIRLNMGGREEDAARMASDIDRIKKNADKELDVYANTRKVVDAYHSAGLMGEKDYFDSLRDLLQAETDVKEGALQAEIKRRERQRQLQGKDRIDNDKQIADLKDQIDKNKRDAGVQTQLFGITETANATRLRKALLDARDAAQQYLDVMIRANQRELQGMGAGAVERQRQGARAGVQDRYEQQRQDLLRSRRDAEFMTGKPLTAEAEANYNDQLKLIKEFQGKALIEFDTYYQARQQMEKDTAIGAQEAIANYQSDAANMAKQSEQVFSTAFKGMEDALVTFVTTGKLSFQSLADSIVADITRMIIKQQISNAIGVGGGAGGGAGSGWLGIALQAGMAYMFGGSADAGAAKGAYLPSGKAAGGPVMAGSLHQVNELGPELLSVGGKSYLMMGAQDGQITPNNQIGAGAASSTVIHINVSAPGGTSRTSATQWGAEAGRQIQRAVARNS